MSLYPAPVIYHVDDSSVDRLVIKKMLQQEAPHLVIHQFPSVSKAVTALFTGENPLPHLLIINLYLPQVMGWNLLEALEQIRIVPVKIVIVSSSIIPEDVQRARQYSVVSDYKTKPLSRRDIHDLLAYLP
uniref:Response regulator n=1 Tax=Roseihalotalea indica TaxID=2867963 RepID=A0AA49GQA1_9BACT|nr:response regulator [Tunicatimonas sp. TK19036]